jgi:hypothetical protein
MSEDERRAGFADWHREPIKDEDWNHHIHSIAIGPPAAEDAHRRAQEFLRTDNEKTDGS